MDRCRAVAASAAGHGYVFLRNGEEVETRLSFETLDLRARALAAELQRRGAEGQRCLLLFPPGPEYVVGFFGCLYAGAVAVPAYPPRRGRVGARLRSIARDCEAAWVLTTADLRRRMETATSQEGVFRGVEWLVADEVDPESAQRWTPFTPDPSGLAFLQYTSGSTSEPKGVRVLHGNLAHNEGVIQEAFGVTPESVIVSWLPMYHDMGLIGGVLQPLWADAGCVLMSPMSFLQRPARWLEAVSRFGGTISGGPDFAYALCAERVEVEQLPEVDLSRWAVAFNGSEPVMAATLERFSQRFAPLGFRARGFFPCYGLAEATLLVSGTGVDEDPALRSVSRTALERGRAEDPEAGEAQRRLVGSGSARGGQRVRIVDPESGRTVPDGVVGEIWVSSRSVADGYWRKPETSREVFEARLAGEVDRFLRTGDLGFLDGGELFVTGRLKDLLILRGRNVHPQDLERVAAASHPGLRTSGGAAFAVEVDGREAAVLVQEVERRFDADPAEVVRAVRTAVAEVEEVRLHDVALIRAGRLPRTSSGKVQRHRARQLYLDGDLALVPGGGGGDGAGTAAGKAEPSADASPPVDGLDPLESLVHSAAELLDVPAGELDGDSRLEELGLDSMAAMEWSRRLELDLGVVVPLTRLLDGGRLGDLAGEILGGTRSGAAAPAASETAGGYPPGEPFPLSAGQRALWLLERLAPEDGGRHIARAVRSRERLSAAELRRAFAGLARRHPALRTRFGDSGGEPWQRVAEDGEIPLRESDAVDWSERRFSQALVKAAYEPFRSDQPRARLHLFHRGDHDVLVFVVHHLVADFRSLARLGADLAEVVAEGEGGAGPAVDYGEFVAWERAFLEGAGGERSGRFWRDRLDPLPEPLDLRHAEGSAGGEGTAMEGPTVPGVTATVRGRLDAATWTRLGRLAADCGATPFALLLTAYRLLLARTLGHGDPLVAVPVAASGPPRFAAVVGYMVNTLLLRGELAASTSLADALKRSTDDLMAALEHRQMPLPEVVRRLRGGGRADGGAPAQAMLVHYGQLPGAPHGWHRLALGGEAADTVAVGPWHLSPYPLPQGRSEWALGLATAPDAGGGLDLALEYAADRFGEAEAETLARRLETLLRSMAQAPRETRLADLTLEPEQALSRVEEWSAGAGVKAGLAPPPWLARLSEVVATRGGEIAVVGEAESWTFADLDRRSGRLAGRLRELGVGAHGAETRVGLLLPRSPLTVEALVAVLRAGGVAVPMDPAQPAARRAAMVEDAGVEWILARREDLGDGAPEAAGGSDVPRALLWQPGSGWDGAGQAPGLAWSVPPAQALAYVIFTSGSTGRPRGVAVSHGALSAFVAGLEEEVLARHPEVRRVSLNAPLTFDASVQQWGQLALGRGVVVVTAEQRREAAALLQRVGEAEVDLLDCTPSHLRLLLDAGLLASPRPRQVLVGGEALEADLWRRLTRGAGDPPRFFNVYGPTEATVDATAAPVTGERPTLGGPLPHVRTHVVDRMGRPAGVGVVGEVWLGGGALARGYVGRPSWTAERFVPDAYGEEAGGRLYRTGDLARWRPSGDLESLGRADRQVKVRGFRIEPGEVEAVLARHPAVRLAAVDVAGAGPGARLVAWVVGAEGEAPAPATLRRYLGEHLPAYMVPASFVALEALPLTAHGKLDRSALPPPEAKVADGAGSEADPLTGVVLQVFADLLPGSRVGPEDDFFAFGGHSLLAARLAARAGEALGLEVPVRWVFETPTAAALARRIAGDANAGGPGPEIPAVPRREDGSTPALPLAPAQAAMWLHQRMSPESPLYHLAGAIRLAGDLDVGALRAALLALRGRHEALRTVFPTQPADDGAAAAGSEVRQRALAVGSAWAMPRVDLGAVPAARAEGEASRLIEGQARRPFDLETGPLFRSCLLRLRGDDHRLLLVLHHLVCDGASLAVMLRELPAFYAAARRGEAPPAEPAVAYLDHAVALHRRAVAEEAAPPSPAGGEESAVPDLPFDRPRPALPRFRGIRYQAPLPAGLGGHLEALARERAVTPSMVVAAAFLALVGRWGGSERPVVGTPVAGRPPSASGVVGLFTQVRSLAPDLRRAASFRGLLRWVRSQVVDWVSSGAEVADGAAAQASPGTAPWSAVVAVESSLAPFPLGEEVRAEPRVVPTGTAKFDLTLTVRTAAGGEWEAELEANRDLFEAATLRRLHGRLGRLLQRAVAHPERPLAELDALSAGERHQVLVESGGRRDAHAPSPRTVPALILAQARRCPDAPALVDATRGALSYGGLVAAATVLAGSLRGAGVAAEGVVAVVGGRTAATVVGWLAAWLAGAAYLPLDPNQPPARLAGMVEDSGAGWLLSDGVVDLPGLASVRRMAMPELKDDAPDRGAAAASPTMPPADRLAYVIYTSGSSGRPKGVAVSHGALGHLVRWHRDRYRVSPGDRGSHLAGAGFDAAVWEVWPYLAAGARLELATEEVRSDPARLSRWLRQRRVDLAYVPTPLVEAMLSDGLDPGPGLRAVLTGGDRLRKRPPAEIPWRLVNHYGPTECTVVATAGAVSRLEPVSKLESVSLPGSAPGPPHIGRPLPHLAVRLVSRGLGLVGPGDRGEIALAGASLARGYLGRPALTAAAFVPDPWGEPGSRLYRTGDLARWDHRGRLVFLGRTDRQLQVQGLRMELGEVEALLRELDGVRDALVQAHDGEAGPRLVAHLRTAGSEGVPGEGELRRHLAARLPGAMLPAAFVTHAEWPLTANGKIDRRALAAAEPAAAEHVAPRTETERKLAAIWEAALEVEGVGVEDSFFALGGRSLQLTRMLSRVHLEMGVEVGVRDFMATPTIAGLSREIARALLARRAAAMKGTGR